jgi:histone H3/H4
LNEDEIKLVYSNILGAIVHFPLKKDTFGVPKESIERIVKKIIEKYPKKVQNLVLEFLSDQLSN